MKNTKKDYKAEDRHVVNLHLLTSHYEQLKKMARYEDTTVGQYIRSVLKMHIQEYGGLKL